MANPPPRGSLPDDDSWGKIASDLFGIQFNEDDDFELPDDESPVAKSEPTHTAAVPEVVAEDIEVVAHADAAADEPEPAKAGSKAGNEDNDEFWDILESWNWDETSKSSPEPRRSDDSRGRRSRHEPSKPEQRRSQREESPRREESRHRDEAPRREEPARAEEVTRREEAPRREEKRRDSGDRPRRRDAEPARESVASGDDDAQRSRPQREGRDRPARTERPPRSRRPEGDRSERPVAERPAAEKPPSERRPERRTRETASPFVDDEFGSGVEESAEVPRPRQPHPARKREEPAAPPPRKSPVARRPEPKDEFEGDLFVDDSEDELDDEAPFGADEETGEETVSEESAPRRRRRRRRRGRGRSPAEAAASRDSDLDDESPVDDSGPVDELDESLAEPEAADEDQEETREARRPRRRRRRRGRRPGTTAAMESDVDDADEGPVADLEEEEDRDEIQEIDEDSDSVDTEDEEEVVVPISYEGIPTWEEAISYLVITPPSESRGHRGRNEGHRRDDSRRR